jgi:hypothetical protein
MARVVRAIAMVMKRAMARMTTRAMAMAKRVAGV